MRQCVCLIYTHTIYIYTDIYIIKKTLQYFDNARQNSSYLDPFVEVF